MEEAILKMLYEKIGTMDSHLQHIGFRVNSTPANVPNEREQCFVNFGYLTALRDVARVVEGYIANKN